MTYKSDLVAKVATRSGTTKKLTQEIIDNLFDEISIALKDDGGVNISGFGVFKVKDRPARKGRNPSTGAEIDIAASKSARFDACKALREQLNK